MKRNPAQADYERYEETIKVKKVFPLFYTRCDCCKREFKLERGYEYKSRTPVPAYLSDFYITNYGCNECFNSIEDFKAYALKNYKTPYARFLVNNKRFYE